MAENLGLPEQLGAQSRIPLYSRNGLPVLPNVWHLYEMMVQVKTIDPHPDPAKLFNDTIVEPTKRLTLPAAEELGLQHDPEIERMLKGDYPVLAEAGRELLRGLGAATAQEVDEQGGSE